MKIDFNVPKLIDTVCITESVHFAAELSSIFNRKNHYFPIIEPPRISRQDASNEAIKINNAIARAKSKKIIFAGLNQQQKDMLYDLLPIQRIITIDNKCNIEQVFKRKLLNTKGVIHANHDFNPIVLYKAFQRKSRVLFDGNFAEELHVKNEFNSHLIICENRHDITSVIATNYAISLNATIIFYESLNENDIDEINDVLFNLYETDLKYSQEEKMLMLIERIKSLIPSFEVNRYQTITFFSKGLPFGIAFPEIPTTHIFITPLLGVHLCESVSASQTDNSQIKVALLVDPGHLPASEIENISPLLSKKGAIVRTLRGTEATAVNMSHFCEVFPFDLLLISSHANESHGNRITYEYTDSENTPRKLVVDEAYSLSFDPHAGLYNVVTFTNFVSLDGLAWSDSEEKSRHYFGKAITDFSLMSDEQKNRHIVNKVRVKRVDRAMAYSMTDDKYFPSLQGIADSNCPVVISNACSSWRQMAHNFIFAGSRAFISPVIDITNIEAIEIANLLFNKYLHLPLSYALWKTQNDIYGCQIRRPFVMTGSHFTAMRFPDFSVRAYFNKRLLDAIIAWQRKANDHPAQDVRRNSLLLKEFLEREMKIFNRKY